MMHKCINKLVLDYLADMFKLRSQVHNRQTQSSGALNKLYPYVACQQGSALLLLEEPNSGTPSMIILSPLNAPGILGVILQMFY